MLSAAGWTVIPAPRLGYPADRATIVDIRESERRIGDIVYHYQPDVDRNRRTLAPIDYVAANADWVADYLRRFDPAIVLSASYYWNGMAGVLAARRLGRRHVYEMRGLEWLTRCSADAYFAATEGAQPLLDLETAVGAASDHVFTITPALRALIDREGISTSASDLPNGVSLALDDPVAKRSLTIAYVGSINEYEGIDPLLDALTIVRLAHCDMHVDIVGDGRWLDRMRAMATRLGLDDVVTFHGALPHDEATRFNDTAAIAVISRRRSIITETIAPMKLGEAMNHNCCVVSATCRSSQKFCRPRATLPSPPDALARSPIRSKSC